MTTQKPLPDTPFPAGSVWLTGAGPGDPGLLTLHALSGLERADAIVYDALVDSRTLSLANPAAELIYAGKRGGKASPKQPDITNLLIELARAGRRVLRLKGGDPFVFGRGAEEARALAEAGIPFRVVPGISAGIGGLAYAGIPVTSRDTNEAVTFITGHAVTGDVPDGLNWRALAEGAPVLILYMALKHLDRIAANLLAAGRPADEPVAVIANATTDNQLTVRTTLRHAARDAHARGLAPPAIVAIGPVVDLAAILDWWRPEPVPVDAERAG